MIIRLQATSRILLLKHFLVNLETTGAQNYRRLCVVSSDKQNIQSRIMLGTTFRVLP